MELSTSTLRPGLLVAVTTSTGGNVQWFKQVIESDHTEEETGARRAKWETTRTITDPEEFEAATKVRSKARSLISSVCARSAFGYLCPEDKKDKLDAVVREAQALVKAFNDSSKLTRVRFSVIAGRIAPDDVEAVKAINGEVRDLIEAMSKGIRNLDVKVIRDSATRAKQIGQMLSPDAQARITIAIDTARAVAKDIVKAGETAAVAVDEAAIRKVLESRTAFLDLDEQAEIGAPVVESRGLDLEPSPAAGTPSAPASFPVDCDFDVPTKDVETAPAAAVPAIEV